ncbi:TPA: hypothetical protein ACTTVN_002423 [Legionella anisa]
MGKKRLLTETSKKEGDRKMYNDAIRDWLNNPLKQPPEYKDAVKLRDHIEQVLNAPENKNRIKQETREAAQALVTDLSVAIENWKKAIKNNLEVEYDDKGILTFESDTIETREKSSIARMQANSELVRACNDTVSSHKSLLMKDPGFWEQIKESINNWTEKHGLGKFFEVKQTLFATKKEIQDSVENLDPEQGPQM